MKKLNVLSGFMLMALLSIFIISKPAAAQTSITNTGPGSTNTITDSSTTNTTLTCDNAITVTTNNDQTSSSGSATTSGNTTAGDASSGNASNSSSSVSDIAVSCGAAANTTTPPSTPGQQPVGGAGAGFVLSSVAGAQSARIASLPKTGELSLVNAAAVPLASLGGLAVTTQIGIALIRRKLLG